jgi:hypothetical protein
MIWLIVVGVLIVLIVIGSVRSARERRERHEELRRQNEREASRLAAAGPGGPVPGDSSKLDDGGLLVDPTGRPMSGDGEVQLHEQKFFPPTTAVQSAEGVRGFAEPLLDAAERAAAAEGTPTEFERYIVMVREDMSMNLMLKWSAPVPARAVHAMAKAMVAEARRLGGRPGSVSR